MRVSKTRILPLFCGLVSKLFSNVQTVFVIVYGSLDITNSLTVILNESICAFFSGIVYDFVGCLKATFKVVFCLVEITKTSPSISEMEKSASFFKPVTYFLENAHTSFMVINGCFIISKTLIVFAKAATNISLRTPTESKVLNNFQNKIVVFYGLLRIPEAAMNFPKIFISDHFTCPVPHLLGNLKTLVVVI